MAHGSSPADRRHLTDNSGAPVLADKDVGETGIGGDATSPALTVREPGPPSARAVTPETSLDWAEVAAMLGDFDEALSWLEYVESQDIEIPPEFAGRRVDWTRAVAAERS
jgi:hypothetical protein